MSEERKHLEPIGEDELALERAKKAKQVTPYNHFVESVVSRDIAKIQEVDPGRVAHIFRKDSAEGVEVNIVGSEEVVKPIGDVLEMGGYKVREWHIKRAEDPKVEAEKVRGEATELVRQMAGYRVLSGAEAVRLLAELGEAKPEELLESKADIEAVKKEVDKLAAEGSPFQKLGEDLNKQIEGGSEDGKATS